MVGFVLGLGDRHSSNILVDTRSAEFVHIDLGIAFDQGRLLRTPESVCSCKYRYDGKPIACKSLITSSFCCRRCVPFRLTRDVEDGFGINGVDGVFRGAAEQTMRALRAKCQSLITVLQVKPHHNASIT
jgi:ataxia telangiectasia mutated family protein